MSNQQYWNQPTKLNLRSDLRAARVTIREFAAECGITLKRVRELSELKTTTLCDYLSFGEAISRVRLGRF